MLEEDKVPKLLHFPLIKTSLLKEKREMTVFFDKLTFLDADSWKLFG